MLRAIVCIEIPLTSLVGKRESDKSETKFSAPGGEP